MRISWIRCNEKTFYLNLCCITPHASSPHPPPSQLLVSLFLTFLLLSLACRGEVCANGSVSKWAFWLSSVQSVPEVPLRRHLDCTNTAAFWSVSSFCFTLIGAPAVGRPRETLGSGRTLRPAPWQRTNQRHDTFTPLPCCSLAPTYWLCGSF